MECKTRTTCKLSLLRGCLTRLLGASTRGRGPKPCAYGSHAGLVFDGGCNRPLGVPLEARPPLIYHYSTNLSSLPPSSLLRNPQARAVMERVEANPETTIVKISMPSRSFPRDWQTLLTSDKAITAFVPIHEAKRAEIECVPRKTFQYGATERHKVCTSVPPRRRCQELTG